jgi:ELWxxDGT repeat protein
VIEIQAGTSSVPVFLATAQPFAPLGDSVLLSLTDGVSGHEPWSVASTGATLLADITPGAEPSDWPSTGPFTSLGDVVLFAAGGGPWRSDGTPLGTAPIADLAISGGGWSGFFARVGGRILFLAGGSLWETSGDVGSASSLLADGSMYLLQPAGDRAYVFGGQALHVVDGDLPPAIAAPFPGWVWQDWTAAVGDRLFFAVETGSEGALWTSDGTGPGTHALPGPTLSGALDIQDLASYRARAAAVGDRLVFMGSDPSGGREPWVSDGTVAGTHRLVDLVAGSDSSDPRWFVGAGDRAFFVADDGQNGRELWVSDGTAIGTRLVTDIVAGGDSSRPRNLAAFGSKVLFNAWHPDFGVEAWVSDGTPEGTFRWSDIAAGPLSSSPLEFAAAGDHVYFAANDHATGFEVWAVGTSELASTPTFFHTATPCRAFDSRQAAAIGSSPRRVEIAGTCGIPSTARAVAANVTVVAGTASGQLLAKAHFAPGAAHELATVAMGRTRGHHSILRLGYGSIDLSAAISGASSVHVIVDVTGWFE